MDGEDFVASLADRLDPAAGDRGGKVGIGYFGERGEKEWLNHVSEQRENDSEGDGRHGYKGGHGWCIGNGDPWMGWTEAK